MMPSLFKLFIIFCLALLPGTIRPAASRVLLKENNPDTLYPPSNFQGDPTEMGAHLYWQKPQLPNGSTPPGLVGYYIYRNGCVLIYINSGETLYYYDFLYDYGIFTYTITANYDLAFYGEPGQFGESPPAGPITIIFIPDNVLPFYEPWDQGMFSYYDWHFYPARGNWAINTTDGNPLPTAVFTGSPAAQNYCITMLSVPLPGHYGLCANMFAEFDYKLNDISAGGTEKLTMLYYDYVDSAAFPAFEINNEGSTGWVHQVLDISQVCGKQFFQIGFQVSGSNSANISSWSIDNILVYQQFKGPTGCTYSVSGNSIHLFWQPPNCDSLQIISGYNIYRTNPSGNPPFNKINSTLITGLEYIDSIPSNITNGAFRYLISDLQINLIDSTLLGEGFCDTLSVDYFTGIPVAVASGVRFFPQPATDHMIITSSTPIKSFEFFTIAGEKLEPVFLKNQDGIVISVHNLLSGVYLVKIINASGHFFTKALVMH